MNQQAAGQQRQPCVSFLTMFGSRLADNNEIVDVIARQCHEINRAYCVAIGDLSQPPWEHAPSWQKESARVGVRLHLRDPFATPEQSHESWYRQKEADGWKYGSVKDEQAKLHPCMVPYCELAVEQRAKDSLFKATVHGAAELLRVQHARDTQALRDALCGVGGL